MVLPEDDGPNSLVKSTVIVRMLPFTESSTFFKDNLRVGKYRLGSSYHILQRLSQKSEDGDVGGIEPQSLASALSRTIVELRMLAPFLGQCRTQVSRYEPL